MEVVGRRGSRGAEHCDLGVEFGVPHGGGGGHACKQVLRAPPAYHLEIHRAGVPSDPRREGGVIQRAAKRADEIDRTPARHSRSASRGRERGEEIDSREQYASSPANRLPADGKVGAPDTHVRIRAIDLVPPHRRGDEPP
jgi:hypothetical protein